MSKKKNGYGNGTFIESKMFLSPAFISLGKKGTSKRVSVTSLNIIIFFLGKRKFANLNGPKGRKEWGRVDDNKFTLTYKELENRGILQGAATRGIDELLAKGFISIVDPGGAFEKHKAIYALEDKYRDWKYDPEKKKEDQMVFSKRKLDVFRGYQGGKYRAKPKLPIEPVSAASPHACQQEKPLEKMHP